MNYNGITGIIRACIMFYQYSVANLHYDKFKYKKSNASETILNYKLQNLLIMNM